MKTAVTLDTDGQQLILRFPYDPGLVAAVKSLPATDRRWDDSLKAWIIDPAAGQQVAKLILSITGQHIQLPTIYTPKPETKILSVWYIGRCKDRNGEKIAFGMLDNYSWNVLFPESALREWFEAGEVQPNEQSNLFAILGVSKTATLEEIKTGYRKMVKIWHPDVNRNDPDAPNQFMRIQEAWDVLSVDRSRERYLAGLMLEESMHAQPDTQYQTGNLYEYRSPLRCGVIMAEGVQKTGRFVVSKILAWRDIINDAGQMMVTSWPSGAKVPSIAWV